MEERGERSIFWSIMEIYRVYARLDLIEVLYELGFGEIDVLPDR